MAILVETQGEKVDNIEDNVVNAAHYIHGGTSNLYYASNLGIYYIHINSAPTE